ncbi:C4-dicarboxylate ABC transporter [Pokkaliibacter plantistimulans]|uniref:C4-dicarboxylate ABC transporter n=1 Tax=Proteobacteria bacterium 228 TaxID=2083153 RepID=A0A2S5KHH2_9PROT|nr:TRAP transporter permease [Pokkaliibacter plantistimulans]PPC74220.1 C4-dicarboxylate ABC transporter [Pokkaliibacter plantistimulans]
MNTLKQQHTPDQDAPASADLEKIVSDNEVGGRQLQGATAALIKWVAVAWSCFQLWYASPLPFSFGFGVFNDTEAKSIHLAIGLFLVFASYPFSKGSPSRHIPLFDWCLALLGAFAGAYIYLMYQQIALRPGLPTAIDLWVSAIGLLILLEATRRSLGMPMVLVALVFVVFAFAGPYMPDALQHKGTTMTRFLNQQWLTNEGVYGVALGVSTTFIFLFVLFGTLLEKAGAGNWMIQLSIAFLGHLKGGPAKVAVVSSALNGMVSGSSVANVVSTGIFTIPLMKRTGLSGIKAGAIEAASSINGQIMPPVMGAAAFLMVEYVGMPYGQILKHAFLPALFSYLSLLYIVHLESLKIDAKTLQRSTRPFRHALLSWGLGLSGTLATLSLLYFSIMAIQSLLPAVASSAIAVLVACLYVAVVYLASRSDDLHMDDGSSPIESTPLAWHVARTGLDFLIPLGVLLWCLMVERMSPGLAAFWATVTVSVLLLTRRPLLAWFRGEPIVPRLRLAGAELIDGLATGARQMSSLAVATATAGIIVGVVGLTGLGLMLTDFVEMISGGNLMLMLVLIALLSLVMGMGIPTTANYIVIATLMAPVVVELGAKSGLAIPLIAVHLYVFYFGIMADVTPPVGLASYAASAVSRENPIATGMQAAVYSLRTAVLPFVFIFNPTMLLIGITNWWIGGIEILASLLACLLFAAATMGWFFARSKKWESALLLVITFTLFRPDFWLDTFYPKHVEVPGSQLLAEIAKVPANGRLDVIITGININGDDVSKTVNLRLDAEQDPQQRLRDMGVSVAVVGGKAMITNVNFSSYAKKIGIEPGYEVTTVLLPAPRPSTLWPVGIAFALTALIACLQRRRQSQQQRQQAILATA